jgi:hypothetical protein
MKWVAFAALAATVLSQDVIRTADYAVRGL